MNLTHLYILLVGLITLFAAWPALRRLRILQDQRRESIKRHPEPGAVPARTRKKAVREQQIRRMESRISITRRTLIALFLLSGISISAIPYLAQLAPAVLPIIIAAVSVVIGVAAKPIIENITCGLVLCFGKLARIGDTVVIDDVYGTIEDFTLTHSVVKRWDSLRYVVPNSSMMTKEFVNYSLYDNNRWVYVEFWIDYQADMELVERLAKESPLGSQYYSDREPPRFWVAETGREGVKCMVVAWAVTPADGWMLSHDIRKALVFKLKQHDIITHTHHIHMDRPMEPITS
ncbi:mechanosensitive ion channel family protein [Tichowtungia aerotolerans]|uniref:Mechanosensitive ion channel n=1 Tax=Tichowtungia aerotolerans TaxID=2697043 RepID=A0A6P1M245_9BACT|nr:mechanosensitive ion channel domain-containing protein [Tichowtungia aerotolerans]QHI68660.1 mechanosensitive ion channel [Tichowtungia aerotolerans]